MKNIKIITCNKNPQIQDFTFKPGFVALVEEKTNKILAITSGWKVGGWKVEGNLFVYRPQQDGNGTWKGDWECEEYFPIKDVLNRIQAWQENEEIKKTIAYTKGKTLYVSLEPIRFTNVVPGKKYNNDGEYGFYTCYIPITEYPGIYRVYTECTCDFDRCKIGYEGIRALTVQEYRKLRKASDEVEDMGSLY